MKEELRIIGWVNEILKIRRGEKKNDEWISRWMKGKKKEDSNGLRGELGQECGWGVLTLIEWMKEGLNELKDGRRKKESEKKRRKKVTKTERNERKIET